MLERTATSSLVDLDKLASADLQRSYVEFTKERCPVSPLRRLLAMIALVAITIFGTATTAEATPTVSSAFITPTAYMAPASIQDDCLTTAQVILTVLSIRAGVKPYVQGTSAGANYANAGTALGLLPTIKSTWNCSVASAYNLVDAICRNSHGSWYKPDTWVARTLVGLATGNKHLTC